MGRAFSESVEGARRSRELVRRWNQVCLYLQNVSLGALVSRMGLVSALSVLISAEQVTKEIRQANQGQTTESPFYSNI